MGRRISITTTIGILNASAFFKTKNVWGIDEDDEDILIDQAIIRTEEFFVSLGVRTKLSEYEISESGIAAVIEKMANQNKVNLGEQKALTQERLKTLLQMRF